MQNPKEEFKEYSDILNSEFCDWDGEFFSENLQLSDVENKFQSQQLIKNLQCTSKGIVIPSDSLPICREISRNRKVEPTKWNESILCTVNKSRDLVLKKKQNSTDTFSLNKTTSCIRKHPDEHSDSEDFCTPNKKLKKTQKQSVDIFVKTDKDFTRTDVPLKLVNNEIDRISIIEVPLEETSKSQSDVVMCSQETIGSQMEAKTASNRTISSQENCISQTSCSQTSLSPTVINSSQESLGNKIMKICIQENGILNAINHSKTHIDITPPISSACQHEEVKRSNTNSNTNAFNERLKVYHQRSSSNDTFSSSSKKKKAAFPEKNKFAEKCSCSVSDTACIKSGRQNNKEQKRTIWIIRKRELKVTKKEKELHIREKQLDAREADIQKREAILQARVRKYANQHITKIKNKLQNRGIKIKKLKKRLGVLEGDTNSFNTRTTKGYGLVRMTHEQILHNSFR